MGCLVDGGLQGGRLVLGGAGLQPKLGGRRHLGGGDACGLALGARAGVGRGGAGQSDDDAPRKDATAVDGHGSSGSLCVVAKQV